MTDQTLRLGDSCVFDKSFADTTKFPHRLVFLPFDRRVYMRWSVRGLSAPESMARRFTVVGRGAN